VPLSLVRRFEHVSCYFFVVLSADAQPVLSQRAGAHVAPADAADEMVVVTRPPLAPNQDLPAKLWCQHPRPHFATAAASRSAALALEAIGLSLSADGIILYQQVRTRFAEQQASHLPLHQREEFFGEAR
jgi:hypothetical protein